MKEEQIKVLRTMIEATSRMDLNMFAKAVNLTPNETIQQIQELAKEGFLLRSERGYGVTEKGKAALKAFVAVREEMSFHFYFGVDQPADFTAKTLQEFYKAIQHVSAASLEFHLYRGDFENWLKQACKELELAEQIGSLKAASLKGEALRAELLRVLDAKYGIKELM